MVKIEQIFFFIQIWHFKHQSKALVDFIRDMLFLKTLKVMQSDYMTKNKKTYIAYNAYTKKNMASLIEMQRSCDFKRFSTTKTFNLHSPEMSKFAQILLKVYANMLSVFSVWSFTEKMFILIFELNKIKLIWPKIATKKIILSNFISNNNKKLSVFLVFLL
jgi:hypothetical protein